MKLDCFPRSDDPWYREWEKTRTRSERTMDAKTDESAGKCPFTGGTRAHTNRDWWPNQLDLQVLHQRSTLSNPMGGAFDYAKEFRPLAGRLWPLRGADDPHGVAQRGHIPHRRRPRWRRLRPAAVRAAQQLAGQREPRQGAPAAVADQAEVRAQDLVGRPHDPHRQRRAREEGLQDIRLRRRTPRHVGGRSGRVFG